jgi:hypothetical protein
MRRNEKIELRLVRVMDDARRENIDTVMRIGRIDIAPDRVMRIERIDIVLDPVMRIGRIGNVPDPEMRTERIDTVHDPEMKTERTDIDHDPTMRGVNDTAQPTGTKGKTDNLPDRG